MHQSLKNLNLSFLIIVQAKAWRATDNFLINNILVIISYGNHFWNYFRLLFVNFFGNFSEVFLKFFWEFFLKSFLQFFWELMSRWGVCCCVGVGKDKLDLMKEGHGRVDKGGFHLHLFVFPFVYRFNSRIGVLVKSSFAND